MAKLGGFDRDIWNAKLKKFTTWPFKKMFAELGLELRGYPITFDEWIS